MAIFLPSDARAKDYPKGPEHMVLEALRKCLDDSWTVIPNLSLAKHAKQFRGEADIVVIHDGVAILMEVKGGIIKRDKKGRWSQNGRELKSPIDQAIGNFHTIKDYSKAANDVNGMMDWCCVFPQSVFDVKSPEWREDQVMDSRSLASGIHNSLIRLHDRIVGEQLPRLGPRARLDQSATERFARLLRPEIDGTPTVLNLVGMAEIEVENLEKEQTDMLSVLLENPRVILTGGAGTGKTVLGYFACIERLKRNLHTRGAYVCRSDHLAKDIRARVLRSGFANRFDVFSLGELAKFFWDHMVVRDAAFEIKGIAAFAQRGVLETWALAQIPRAVNNLGIRDEMQRMLEAGNAERALVSVDGIFSGMPQSDKRLKVGGMQYDVVVVDEAQDFNCGGVELCYLSAFTKGGLVAGNVIWIQDQFQSILPYFEPQNLDESVVFLPEQNGYVRCPLPPKNYRNPPGVAKLVAALSDEKSFKSIRSAQAVPDYELIECPGGSVDGALRSVLKRLSADGVASRDIALVSVDGYGDEQLRAGYNLDGLVLVKVPAGHEDSTLGEHTHVIRAMNTLEAKGREFAVVILVDVPEMNSEHDRNLLHVAMSRAKAKLYVLCGSERLISLKAIFKEFDVR